MNLEKKNGYFKNNKQWKTNVYKTLQKIGNTFTC